METKLYFCKTFSLRSLIIVDYALFIVPRQARTIVKEQPSEKKCHASNKPTHGNTTCCLLVAALFNWRGWFHIVKDFGLSHFT